ncbi:DNA independent RNA polymerase I transcription factor [Coemansia sp. RSA 2705]|nr:DNA independent RNA polymerase I transcription factor [Coemansia sp. RSA 2705]
MEKTAVVRPIKEAVSQLKRAAVEPLAADREPAKPTASTAINKQVFLRKFVENTLQQVKEGDLDEYQKLVKVFAYTRYQSATAAAAAAKYVDEVSPWILALSANVSALGITYRELVHTVFFSDWITAPNPRFVTRYATLILQIVSAHPEWVPQAMGALVRWFSFGARRSDTAEAPLVHDRVHLLVQEIYRTIPTCGSSLVAALSGAWPFRTIKTNVQVLFVRNTLQCLEYAEGVRRDVLRMVLNHVIQIDVEVQVELDDLESDSEDEAGGAEVGVFEFEEDANDIKHEKSDKEQDGSDAESESGSESDSDSESVVSEGSELGRARFNAKRTVAKLDALLSTLLTWLERHCQPEPESNEMTESTSRLFLVFLDLFDAVILPTFKSRYTQFVVFYLCAKSSEYADVFLGTMVGNVGEPVRGVAQDHVSSVAKVAAAAYLGSFVARAQFLSAPIVRSVVGVLIQWANTYLDWYDEQQAQRDADIDQQKQRTYAQALSSTASPQVEMERHIVFHAVTQSILYMFCFRWRDLAQTQDGGAVIESELDNLHWCTELEGLQRVVFSRLNPLRSCAPAVAQQFASVASQTNFMFCYAVLQQNRRSRANSSVDPRDNTQSPGGDPALQTRLDSFFPFDPMALPVSRQFIDGIYLEWRDVGHESEDEDEDEDAGEQELAEDEAGVVEQIVAMSISPVPPLSALPGRDFSSQL